MTVSSTSDIIPSFVVGSTLEPTLTIENPTMTTQESVNDQLLLIGGLSAGGKTASLRNLPNQENWLYLNCESGKRPSFRNKLRNFKVSDPYQVPEAFQYAKENPKEVDGIIIDSLTYLMDMFESQYVLKAANTMTAWSDYGQYFKNLMQQHVTTANIPVIIIAHVKDEIDETTATMKTSVPIKGALRNQGVESYFSTVVHALRMSIKDLAPYKNPRLNITEEDEANKYKHVFQTRVTDKTINARIRSPMGMFDRQHTYIDNDAYLLLEHLKEFYSH